MKKNSNIVFIILLLCVFFAGIYVILNSGIKRTTYVKEGMETDETCPDLLVFQSGKFVLKNSRSPDDDDQMEFNTLDEYVNYVEAQMENGIHCPVLYFQEETNAQGEDVYRVRSIPDLIDQSVTPIYPSTPQPIFQQAIPTISEGDGLILNSPMVYPYNPILGNTAAQPTPVVPTDASLENPPYNSGNYSGFDPQGQYIGVYTTLDAVHDSTAASPISDNPMDPNWGGVKYTWAQVKSGKYDENKVDSTNYNTLLLEAR